MNLVKEREQCNEFLIQEMTSPEVKEAISETGIVIVHVGSMEQHGPHLPIKTDTSIGFEVSRRAAEKFFRKTGNRVLLAPSLWYEPSSHVLPRHNFFATGDPC